MIKRLVCEMGLVGIEEWSWCCERSTWNADDGLCYPASMLPGFCDERIDRFRYGQPRAGKEDRVQVKQSSSETAR